jgi:hypothetical protein
MLPKLVAVPVLAIVTYSLVWLPPVPPAKIILVGLAHALPLVLIESISPSTTEFPVDAIVIYIISSALRKIPLVALLAPVTEAAPPLSPKSTALACVENVM